MKIFKIIVIVLVAVGLAGMIAIMAAFVTGQRPTRGRRIGTYLTPKQALLVVDVQEDYTGATARAPFPVSHADTLIARINAIIARAQEEGFVICYIGQQLPRGFLFRLITGNRGIVGTPGVKLDRRLKVVNDSYFPKMYADAFSNKDLERYLAQQQVNAVFVCGLDAVHCVDATARGAANRGYRAVVIEGAIATLSAKPMTAIIAGYRRHGVDAVASAEFLEDR